MVLNVRGRFNYDSGLDAKNQTRSEKKVHNGFHFLIQTRELYEVYIGAMYTYDSLQQI